MSLKEVQYIVFRRLTTNDFFHTNKPANTEIGGGGQSYYDVSVKKVSPDNWEEFFAGVPRISGNNGPVWNFLVNSIGIGKRQFLTIGQRREASFNIREQKLHTRKANRVHAWHPDNGFPSPKDPSKREPVNNLVIYIARTWDGEFWAGWYQKELPFTDGRCKEILSPMIAVSKTEGFIAFPQGTLLLDTAEKAKPFSVDEEGILVEEEVLDEKEKTTDPEKVVKKKKIKEKNWDEEAITKALLAEDENHDSSLSVKQKKRLQEVQVRNSKASNLIKKLYKGACQITGKKYTFEKKNGELYSEVHHLIPLGEGGADSPYNLIVVSAIMHRMLHYADVSGIDLSLIDNNKLPILINGKKYTITWHSKHYDLVKKQEETKK